MTYKPTMTYIPHFVASNLEALRNKIPAGFIVPAYFD